MAIKISTIMPVCNTSEYLRESIESVLNQTLKEIELIICVDGVFINSAEVVEEYQKKDSRIKLIKQENLYAGVARNNGLKYATGEYVHFMNSGDWLDVTAYEKLFDKIKDTREDICFFSYYEYDNVTHISNAVNQYLEEHTGYDESVSASFRDMPEYFIYSSAVSWNKLYRRQFLIDGKFKFQDIISAEDRPFYFHTIINSQSVKIYNTRLYYHRMNVNGQAISRTELPYLECRITSNEAILKIGKVQPKHIYKMLVDVCMYDILVFFNRVSADQLFKFWGELHRFFIGLDLSYSDFAYLKRVSSWWDWYIAIKEPLKPKERVVISLTSHPPRISTVSKCIETLMMQSLRVEKIILWLANEQFPNGETDLPDDLLELKDHTFEDGTKFEIRWCEDIRSYKKLIPLLREDSDAVIITVDDDVIYNLDMAKRLYLSYLEFPDSVHAHWITKVFVWEKDKIRTLHGGTYYYSGAHILNKLTGVGGVLYPRNCFHKDILNAELFMRLAPENDDVWFWCMANLNGYYVRPIKNKIINVKYINGTQEVGLWHNANNVNSEGNVFYAQFKNIMNYYPQWREMLENACSANIAKVEYVGKTHSALRNLRKELCGLKSNFQNAICEEVGLNVEEKNDSFYERLAPMEYKRALKEWFMRVTGKELNLAHPADFSEKLQLLKLTDSTPLKGKLADKYAVREWVAEKIGEEYLVPLLGAYNSFDQIDFDNLPQKFVLKCTHGSGYNIIVQDKSDLDLEETKTRVEKWFKTNFAYKAGFELHYSYIQPKIIIEQFLENEGSDLYDYKFTCFNGKVKYVWVDTGRYTNYRRTLFDTNWNVLPFEFNYPINEVVPQRPQNLEKMIELAEKLAQGFSTVRIDFYLLNDGSIKFGEMTFTSASGAEGFMPQYYDRVVGEMLEIMQGDDR